MAIHDGVVWSRAAAKAVAGEIVWGNFRWELFGKCPAFAQGFGGQANAE